MATDLERLVVQLSADFKKYENALNKAMGVTNRQARNIERRFQTMNKNLSSQFTALGGSLAKVFAIAGGVRGAQTLIDTSTQIQNALKVAGLEGENLTKVYDQLFQSAQKNAVPLETLVTLYSRAAMAAKNLGASQDDLTSFSDNVAMSLRVAGKSSTEAAGALLQLSQLLSGSVVQAQEYNSLIDGAYPLLQAVAAGLKEAGGDVGKLTALVKAGEMPTKAFFDAFQAGSVILRDKVAGAELTVSQHLVRLRNVLVDAAGDFNKGSGAAEAFGKMLSDVADIISQTDFSKMGEEIAKYIGWVNDARVSLMSWMRAHGEAVGRYLGTDSLGEMITGGAAFKEFAGGSLTITSSKALQRRIDEAFGDAVEAAGGLTEQAIQEAYQRRGQTIAGGKTSRLEESKPRTVSLDDYDKPNDKKKKTAAPKKTADDRFDNLLQGIRDRTEAMRIEAEVTGLVYQEQEKRRMALELEQEALKIVREEARKKGDQDWQNAKLSPEQIAKINEMSEAYAQQAEALRLIEEAQGRAESAANEFYDSFKSGMIGALKGAESFSDALSKILEKLADMVLNSAFDSLFNGATGSGGWLTGIFKGLGFSSGGYTGPGPKNKPAGVVHAGEVVWSQDDIRKAGGVAAVEAMRKGMGGMAMPAAIQAPTMPRLANMGGGGGTINAPVHINIDAKGADREGLMRVEQQVAKLRQEVPSMVISNVRKAQKSNVKLG